MVLSVVYLHDLSAFGVTQLLVCIEMIQECQGSHSVSFGILREIIMFARLSLFVNPFLDAEFTEPKQRMVYDIRHLPVEIFGVHLTMTISLQ